MHILITDDHAVVRRGLREILADSLEGATFSESGNADDALRVMAKQHISILVLDINMPGRSGLDLLKDVKRMYPRLPVIVLSVQPEDQYALRCLKAGASAYGHEYSLTTSSESSAASSGAPASSSASLIARAIRSIGSTPCSGDFSRCVNSPTPTITGVRSCAGTLTSPGRPARKCGLGRQRCW